MSYCDYDADDIDAYSLRQEARFERAARARLNAHPDCRDPAHPGCGRCEECGRGRDLAQSARALADCDPALVSAAPDMRAALELLMADHATSGTTSPLAIRMARAALGKATGDAA